MREFDLSQEQWVEPVDGGFAFPTASKSWACYRSRDELLVGDASDMTASGYPRVIKSWKRGTPLAEAVTVFEGQRSDVNVQQCVWRHREFVHEVRYRGITFFENKRFYRSPQSWSVTAVDETQPLLPVPVPDDCKLGFFADCATIELRSDWCPPGHSETFAAGSLLVAPIAQVMCNDWSQLSVLFRPSVDMSLESFVTTRDYVILQLLRDVVTVLQFWKYLGHGKWQVNKQNFFCG